MRTVDNDRHALVREDFKARGMAHRTQCRANGLLRHAHILALEELCRHDDERGVLRLMHPGKCKFERLRLAADDGVEGDALSSPGGEENLAGKVLAADKDIRAEFLRAPLDDFKRLPCRRRDDGHALLDNARLVLGDAGKCPAAAVGMIHRHICDDRECRLDDIRRVEKPSEPRFDHGNLDLLLSEIEEGKRRQRLELRRMLMPCRDHFIRSRAHTREEFGELLLRDVVPVHTHALRVGDEMRR